MIETEDEDVLWSIDHIWPTTRQVAVDPDGNVTVVWRHATGLGTSVNHIWANRYPAGGP